MRKVLIGTFLFILIAVSVHAERNDTNRQIEQHIGDVQSGQTLDDKKTETEVKETPEVATEKKNKLKEDTIKSIELKVEAKIHDLENKESSRESSLKNLIEQKREEFKSRLEQYKAIFQKEREQFKTKLAEIKDERKKSVVESVDQRLTTINSNRTTQMNNVVTKLGAIVDTLQTKVDAAKANGNDTTSAQAAIDQAKKDVQTALSDVTEQAAKDYPAQITSDTTLKQNVGTTVTSLQTDLQKVYTDIMNAKESVRKAAIEVYKLKVPKSTNGSTPSATTTGQL